MKPSFSVTYPGGNIAPCPVQFVSTPQSKDEEIIKIGFGDGTFYTPTGTEESPIRMVQHTYRNAGTFEVVAIATDWKTPSDPVKVTVVCGSVTAEKGWLRRLIDWFKKLFGL